MFSGNLSKLVRGGRLLVVSRGGGDRDRARFVGG